MLFQSFSFLPAFLTVPTVLATLVAYEVVWIVYCRFFHPLRSIPGPFLASISRTWIVWRTMRGDMEHTQRALHAKHGHLVRIAPNEVACSNPEAIKTIYGIKSGFTKTDFYDAWRLPRPGYPGHFPTRDEKAHAERRKIVNNVYSMSSVLESEQAVNDCTQLFMQTMREFARERKVVDIGQWLLMYAFDVLGELFCGEVFGFLRERTDVRNIIKSFDTLLPVFTLGGVVPSYLLPFVFPATLLFSSVRGALPALDFLQSAPVEAINKRNHDLEDGKNQDKRDMLRKLLDISRQKGEKVNFSHDDMIVETATAFFAGADTTAISLRSILYYLMRSPNTYARLVAEIDEATAAGTLSDPITYGEAIKLPYLNAVIKEAMRMHPGVGLTLPREIPAGGAEISGFYFPEGYRVGVNAAVVHRDKSVFGLDADRYNPNRWIEGDATAMDKIMIPFGSGSRTCIGKNISLSEIYKLIPQFLREFHVGLADPSKEWKTHNFWFNKQTDIEIYVEERQPKC